MVQHPSGIEYEIVQEGSGPCPARGTKVSAHYCGWLQGFNQGPKFDSSRDRNSVFKFDAGVGQVISGWDIMVSEMKKGERRRIVLPPNHGYGARGAGNVIPGNATLYFDMELVDF